MWPIQEAHELVIATPGASDVLRTDREFAAFKGFLVLVTCRGLAGTGGSRGGCWLVGESLARRQMGRLILLAAP